MNAKNIVTCLFEGYCVVEAEHNRMLANCTCTLIKSKNGKNILVDTMTPWDREKLLQGITYTLRNIFSKRINVLYIFRTCNSKCIAGGYFLLS